MAFHDNLRSMRLAHGLTQPALAEAADIEQSYLSKLENGRSMPSDEVLQRLALALGMQPTELLRDAEPGSETRPDRRWQIAAALGLALGLGIGWVVGKRTSSEAVTGASFDVRRHDMSTAELLHNSAPAGLTVEAVDIGEQRASVSVSGRTTGRAPVTSYLATLRHARIGEASRVVLSDGDLRFHVELRLLPTTELGAEEVERMAEFHAAAVERLEALRVDGVMVTGIQANPDGSLEVSGEASSAAAAAAFVDRVAADGAELYRRRVSGDERAATFEFVARRYPALGLTADAAGP